MVRMDINSPISYKFPYAWNSENMPGTPKVNLLLKELIERNYVRAKSLLEHGATFKGIDNTTLRRCLFEFLEDYKLIKFMIDNGYINSNSSNKLMKVKIVNSIELYIKNS